MNIIEVGGTECSLILPCFDSTGKFIFLCCGKFVRMSSSISGKTLRYFSHDYDVVNVCLNPCNCLQLIACTVFGELFFWDIQDGRLIKRVFININHIKVNYIINNASLDALHGQQWFLVASSLNVDDSENENSDFKSALYRLAVFNDHLTVGEKILAQKIFYPVPNDSRKLIIHRILLFFAYLKRNIICVNSLLEVNGRTKLSRLQHVIPDCIWTCLSCTTTEPVCMAAGDSEGRITLWYDFYFDNKEPVRTELHWHTLPVTVLMFSDAASLLFSGGSEAVLVKWNVKNRGVHSKEFLPRLSASIVNICMTPDNLSLAIFLSDNGIRMVSQQLQIKCSIQTFVHREVFPQTGLNWWTRQNALVTNGNPGQLQFYDPIMDCQLFSLEIANENLPPSERNAKHLPTEIINMAICDDWLATVLQKFLNGTCNSDMELTLQFWKYNPEKAMFVLVTSIDHPHNQILSCLLIHPSNRSVLSASFDGKYKLWCLIEEDNSAECDFNKELWNLEYVGSYQDRCCSSCDFSDDGSLIAMAFNFDTLIIMKFPSFLFCGFLTLPTLSAETITIKQLKFGAKQFSNMLIGVIENAICAWDVFNYVLCWCVQQNIIEICRHSISGMFAAFTLSGKIIFFYPNFPYPVNVFDLKEKYIYNAVDSCTVKAVFAYESHGNRNELYFLNNLQVLYCICDETVGKTFLKTMNDVEIVLRPEENGILTSLLNSSFISKDDKSSMKAHGLSTAKKKKKGVSQLLTSGLSAGLSMRVLCDSFLNSCIDDNLNA